MIWASAVFVILLVFPNCGSCIRCRIHFSLSCDFRQVFLLVSIGFFCGSVAAAEEDVLSTTEGKSVGTTLEIDHDDVASAPTTSITTTTTTGDQSTDTARLSAELIAIKSALHGVTVQLGNFQGHYMTTIEAKILQLFTTMTSLHMNLKALQERAHVWDIFKHHIDAWSDHMKSVDKKIDLIKR